MHIVSATLDQAKPAAADESQIATELANRIRRGEKLAEHDFIQRYSKGLFSLLRRKTNDNDLADDLHQDTFRIVLERLRAGGLENPAQLAGFIHATAKNLVIAHFRKQARRKTEPDYATVENASHQGVSQGEAMQRDQQAKLIRTLLAELRSERDRELLLRFYLCEEDKQSICDALDLSDKHFNRVIFRARERFRELLLKHERRGDVRILH